MLSSESYIVGNTYEAGKRSIRGNPTFLVFLRRFLFRDAASAAIFGGLNRIDLICQRHCLTVQVGLPLFVLHFGANMHNFNNF
jgi:hypothetical protein